MFKFLGDSVPDFVDKRHNIIVLNNLVVRASRPRERVDISKSRIDKLCNHLAGGRCYLNWQLQIAQDIARLRINALVDNVSVKALGACGNS